MMNNILRGDSLYGDDRPPWEEPEERQMGFESDDEFALESLFQSEPEQVQTPTKSAIQTAEDIYAQFAEDASKPEIFSKAERFNKLNLLSGNNVPGGVTQAYIKSMYGKEGVMRYKFAKFVMSKMNLVQSPDVMLMLSSTHKARIVIATAGAGKTTSLQVDLIISKLCDKVTGAGVLDPMEIGVSGLSTVALPRILYLNYNKHNVDEITLRHTAVCSAVNGALAEEDAIDTNVESTTVHAFCYRWLSAFSSEITLPQLKVQTDSERETLWNAIITPRWKKYHGDTELGVDYVTMDELYTYKTESMLDWDEFFLTAKFVDTQLHPEFVKACLKKYDVLKYQRGLLDFVDYLTLMNNVLTEHPELRIRLQERYRIIIADENQDFTRLMNELLLKLYNPEVNRLTVVGDPDQTIYSFKGVSPDNVVGLYERLEDVELLGLDTNYRCPDSIVEAAKGILDLNVMRFKKPIGTVKTGGKLYSHPLMQGEQQHLRVLEVIKRLSPEERQRTVVTYRNNVSSLVIAEELFYEGIPFIQLDGTRPFSNPVFQHIVRALMALRDLDVIEYNQDLFRFLPMNRQEWHEVVEYNRQNRRTNFRDFTSPSAYFHRGMKDAMSVLYDISMRIGTVPVCDLIVPLLELYKKYFFRFMLEPEAKVGKDSGNYALYLERAEKFFSRPYTFEYMIKELAERNKDNALGVTLSTFHGLKGLEFDYVIAIDFNDSIFPNYFGIEQKYSPGTILEEKEAENRLCYVLVTRTMKEFHMFYNFQDPSAYVNLLLKRGQQDTQGGKQNDETPFALDNLASGANPNMSRVDYVRKLLGKGG